MLCRRRGALPYFYPRPPRGGRHTRTSSDAGSLRFLSTPSARRATPTGLFSVLSCVISIHALREEGDAVLACSCTSCGVFLSTPSARRATFAGQFRLAGCANFYPRPPRGGRQPSSYASSFVRYFYPRPPRGGRPFLMAASTAFWTFLSTPSARRATAKLDRDDGEPPISIHALREEGDSSSSMMGSKSKYFYPRPPRGGRPVLPQNTRGSVEISIHALREEGDSSGLLRRAGCR